MNKILIILFISTILSCKEEYSVQILDLNTIPLELIKTEKQTMQEIQNPSSMHFFNNHIVFINTENNTDVPFYIYSTDSLNYSGLENSGEVLKKFSHIIPTIGIQRIALSLSIPIIIIVPKSHFPKIVFIFQDLYFYLI